MAQRFSNRERALVSAIFLLSLALRVLAIDVPINVDEGLWMRRGPQFLSALLKGDLANTYLRHHPGVPNLWLLSTAVGLRCLLRERFPSSLNLDQSASWRACIEKLTTEPFFPVSFYVTARLLQALITSACMAYFYVLTRRWLGPSVALGAAALLIFEPFFLAYQRLLTTDALEADFGILSLLLLLLYLRGDGSRRALVVSGVFMGLAAAAKILILFALPAIVIWVILIERGVWCPIFPRRGWGRQVEDLALWGIVSAMTVFALWPTLWVAPMQTAVRFYQDLSIEAAGHNQFFLGGFTHSPGWLFYRLVIAYRTSPALQIGMLLGIGALLIPRLRRQATYATEFVAILLISLSILTILSVNRAKLDRYIIPAMPAMALLATMGWHEAEKWMRPRLPGLWDAFIERHQGIAMILALAQWVILAPHYPYYLTYYNPLLGGPRTAQHLLMIGNGEGLDQAARWLSQHPNAAAMSVSSWYSEAFAPYFPGQTMDLRQTVVYAHRVVMYINQLQRQMPDPNLNAYFAVQKPLYTVRLHGVDYVTVYPGPVPLPDELAHIPTPLDLNFEDRVRLLGYELVTPQVMPGEKLVVTFYWKFLAPLPEDATVYVGLRDPQGNHWGESNAAPIEGYLPLEDSHDENPFFRDVHRLTVLPGTPPGRYQIEIGWYFHALGREMKAYNAMGNPLGTHAVIGEVEVIRPANPPDLESLEIKSRMEVDAGPLRLLGYDRPTGPFRAGAAIPLTLLWQRHQAGDAPFLLSLRLRQNGQTWQRQRPHPISEAYPPAQWQVGELVREPWQALLPAQIASGRYELSLLINGPDGQLLAEVPLGPVDVIARARDFQLPSPQFPLEVTFGDSARLLGYDIPRVARPGETIPVTLYWQALAEMDTAYKVFVHVIDDEGRIRTQQDRPPLNDEAPTTSWVPSEVLRDSYQIPLPIDLPPGHYTLRVGLYDQITGQRLPVTEGNAGPDYVDLTPCLRVMP